MNTKDGKAEWHDVDIGDWVYLASDGSVDVAIREMGIPAWLDHLAMPTSLGVTAATISENEVGPGDEVFVTGLFRHHHGATRNIPIIRIGALACMGEEKVSTSFGEMDALLIEARSIGGLSGSPVFLHLGPARPIKGKVDFASRFFLLGLIHGHYDATEQGIDAFEGSNTEDSSRLTNAQINTGIAIVVPFHSIESVLARYEERKRQSLSFSGDAGLPDWLASG
jgi:hypothetical protein